ncbi:hypothetical protein [Arthrobacter sp. RAF14]|uniref:hypothetical protein n=1 Tax=Arthrobacter sp. RAF14 TaxID=3233051 RepID=UPI003F931B82
MSIEEVFSPSGSAAQTATIGNPAETAAARKLAGRLLTVTSKEAEATAPHVSHEAGGLIVAGASANATVASLRRRYADMVLLAEPSSISDWATADRPFVLDEGGIIPETLEAVLNGQLHNGASAAVTPTGVINVGDAEALKAALKKVNELERDDVLFLVPVHHLWLAAANIKQLTAVLRRSRHPVAIALADSDASPLRHTGAVAGYRALFQAVPWAMSWRADLAAFDAFAHGARAGSIGQLPSLRRVNFPGKHGFSSNKLDNSPHVLVPGQLRYRRSSLMRTEWFASALPDTCDCTECAGRGIDRFNASDAQRLSAHLHNLHSTNSMRQEIEGMDTSHVAKWWIGRLRNVEYEVQALKGRIGVNVKQPAEVKDWLQES